MKILLTFFVLLFSSFANAEYPIANLKLNNNISNYFSDKELKDYNWETRGYGSNQIYSLIVITDPKQILFVNYSIMSIAYNNNTGFIEYVAGIIQGFNSFNQCIEFRDTQVNKSYYDKSFNVEKVKNEHKETGVKQHKIIFEKPSFAVTYNCDQVEDRINYRLDYLTDNFNHWVVELEGTESEYE